MPAKVDNIGHRLESPSFSSHKIPLATSDGSRHNDVRPPTPSLPKTPSEKDFNAMETNENAIVGPQRFRSSSLSERPMSSGPPKLADAHHIWETKDRRNTSQSTNHETGDGESTTSRSRSSSQVQRLSLAEMQKLTSAPKSIPIGHVPDSDGPYIHQDSSSKFSEQREAIRQSILNHYDLHNTVLMQSNSHLRESSDNGNRSHARSARDALRRAPTATRTVSTPPPKSRTQTSVDVASRNSSPRRYSMNPPARPQPLCLNLEGLRAAVPPPSIQTGPPAITTPQLRESPLPTPSISTLPSPMPTMPNKLPLPPMSLPTQLQLEIAAQRPSPLYIYHPQTNEMPYESSAVKFERLNNVLLLPPYLERTLYFGALACLDAWLFTFTILPIRFVIALWILSKWWVYVLWKEFKWLIGFVWGGLGRLKKRGRRTRRGPDGRVDERSRSRSTASEFSVDMDSTTTTSHIGLDCSGSGVLRERHPSSSRRGEASQRSNGQARAHFTQKNVNHGSRSGAFRHKRTKSIPSNLTAFHKADILQGLVIICSSVALMTLDASRMYHFIRAQSAIKLYVIFNILEVGDRLLSALGQDILECLFSTETLSRNASGRSKVLLPMGMFVLALAYNCLHSIALYYQVITLNVAVNSYSNALLTLLLSNQFVEVKSTVFKRFDKDSIFQLTCADIVERFQLWVMLFIIAMRNIVEVGGLSVPGAGYDLDDDTNAGPGPMHNPSILPHSFTVLPSWMMSGEVLSPFLIVIGSEMLVDTIKHAYVTKFNNIKPKFYSRILDILCKDYYTNAFTTPSLTRRLGLAVIPLSCLFIRAAFQTYHMFLSTHLPMPIPPSTQTSLAQESATPSSPAMMAALNRLDTLIRDSLGRATYGDPFGPPAGSRPWYEWTSDDIIATLTMIVFFFITFLVLLILKLLLGMILLRYSRSRYTSMRQKEALVAQGKAEREAYEAKGRRVGGFGHIEVGEERQRWIHADESEGLKGGKAPGKKKEEKKVEGEYNGVFRYDMVGKRIW